MIVQLSVSRLFELYPWPEEPLLPRDVTLAEIMQHPVQRKYVPDPEQPGDLTWQLGRVRYFVHRINQHIDPILVGVEYGPGNRTCWPIVIDGHHRLLAHVLTRRKVIWAEFEGPEHLLAGLRR